MKSIAIWGFTNEMTTYIMNELNLNLSQTSDKKNLFV